MESGTLVVVVRGWTSTGDLLLFGKAGGDVSNAALNALSLRLPGATVWAPTIDLTMFCVLTPEHAAQTLFSSLKKKVSGFNDLKRIVLVGYSSGSLLARRVFCLAHGMGEDGTFQFEAEEWAPKISRLVVLAGITRGWEYSSASPAHVRFTSPLLFGLARIVGWIKSLKGEPGGDPFIWQIRRGSPFIVSTRIQYVRVIDALRRESLDSSDELTANGVPSTVFLLGARDEYISPADCTELGPRDEFAYVELPGCKHSDVIRFDRKDANSRILLDRVVDAISLGFDNLLKKPWALPPSDIDDYLDPMDLSDNSQSIASRADLVDHAVMVVHGIRDNGFWTKRVAREIKTLARISGENVRSPSPSYGYFSMWDFIKPGGRRNATYWFMERYAEVCSRFPNADISFVGHSNGTYIAANALKLCSAIRFKQVVLAGSVVRRDYPWQARSGQVKGVLNYVGSADCVVAFLPAVFEWLGLRRLDVGGAGAFGFIEAGNGLNSPDEVSLNEVIFVKGGHGAAIGEPFWPEIAAFVVNGVVPNRPHERRSATIRALFAMAPAVTLVVLTIALILLVLPIIIAAWLPSQFVSHFSIQTFEFMFYITISLLVSWIAARILREW